MWIVPRQPLFFVDSAAAGHGLVFASGLYSTLLVYDGDTGEIAWTSALTDVRASPTLAGGKLYVASFDGTLSALDPANGASIWSVKGSCCVYDQAPVVDGGRVFQTRTDGTMTAYDTSTGTQLWSRAAFSVGTMAAGHGKIFFNDYPNVVALDEETGARVWATPVGSESEPTAPVLANGMVFVTRIAALGFECPDRGCGLERTGGKLLGSYGGERSCLRVEPERRMGCVRRARRNAALVSRDRWRLLFQLRERCPSRCERDSVSRRARRQSACFRAESLGERSYCFSSSSLALTADSISS